MDSESKTPEEPPCPLGDRSQCCLSHSIEVLANCGRVQTNCHACGSGLSFRVVTRDEALQMLAEQTAHRPPPAELPQGMPAEVPESPPSRKPKKPKA